MISSERFSIEYRYRKNTDFHFQNLGKTTRFHCKALYIYISIYEKKFFFEVLDF